MAIDPKAKISKWFTWGEFIRTSNAEQAKKNIPDAKAQANLIQLAKTIDILRDMTGQPINITSGYRSPSLQAYLRTSGTPDEKKQASVYSLHEDGAAADITPMPLGIAKTVFANVANNPNLSKLFGEFAIKTNTIHLSLPAPYTNKSWKPMWVNTAGQYISFVGDELSKYVSNITGALSKASDVAVATVKKNKIAASSGLIFLIAGGVALFLWLKSREK